MSEFIKWLLAVFMIMVPAMLYVDHICTEIEMPLWALISLTVLFAIAPLSPALVAGKNVFAKGFKISDW
jgi:hypothetical protein